MECEFARFAVGKQHIKKFAEVVPLSAYQTHAKNQHLLWLFSQNHPHDVLEDLNTTSTHRLQQCDVILKMKSGVNNPFKSLTLKRMTW